jgi:hypothetical protein
MTVRRWGKPLSVVRALLLFAGATTTGGCREPAVDAKPQWQVVRAPGTSSCAAVLMNGMAGDNAHREQIGQYDSQAEAEAALQTFRNTPDPMTVSGHTICN